jgi:hypothetical protein
MADRTIKTFETPGGHSVVMYDYITGGEMQEIARKAPKDSNYSAQIDAGNQTMLTLVRELDGSADDLLPRILDLPLPDYQAISAEVQALLDPEKKA